MILINKSYNDKNKLETLSLVIVNDNRQTIERFDATPLLEVVDNDYEAIIELLKQSKCRPITKAEVDALKLYGKPHSETFKITPEEFLYAVENGATLHQLDEMYNLYQTIKNYKVKL